MPVITFWDETHPLTAKANELYDALVPDSGHCETLQGEMLRASAKINYDWFNNGWGCNNWSGAVVFIAKHLSLFPNLPDKAVVDELVECLDFAHSYSHGEPCQANYNGKTCEAVTKIHEIIVEAILANPTPIANARDMHDFREPDYREWD